MIKNNELITVGELIDALGKFNRDLPILCETDHNGFQVFDKNKLINTYAGCVFIYSAYDLNYLHGPFEDWLADPDCE